MTARIETMPRWLRDIAPLVFLMALIFILSAQPTLVDLGGETIEKIFHKSAHTVVYAMLAWLWWRALSPQRQISWPVLFAALALTVLYGISDEYHQSFVPGRHPEIFDMLFDTSGALSMVLLLRFAALHRPKSFIFDRLISI
ncbi:MAG: VanZ family protein [Anaerolineae bacterium]|nr:VanZ family protein [Anaerolineae bacterium]